VTDSSGAVVVGAMGTLTNQDTNVIATHPFGIRSVPLCLQGHNFAQTDFFAS